MSESEPQVPLTAQEWLKEAALQINRLILAACTMGGQSADCNEFERIKDADIDRMEAALLDHLAVRPQEKEAKEAERYRVIRGWGSRSFGVFVSDGNNPLYEAALDRKLDAAIAAQAAQPKDAA